MQGVSKLESTQTLRVCLLLLISKGKRKASFISSCTPRGDNTNVGEVCITLNPCSIILPRSSGLIKVLAAPLSTRALKRKLDSRISYF